jgi:hypothetical protein
VTDLFRNSRRNKQQEQANQEQETSRFVDPFHAGGGSVVVGRNKSESDFGSLAGSMASVSVSFDENDDDYAHLEGEWREERAFSGGCHTTHQNKRDCPAPHSW